MGRPIDADELEKKLAGYFTGDRCGEATMRELIVDETIADTIGIIREQPSVDAVPVIRCKDCKYWGADGYRNGCKYATRIMIENDYCSRAERKQG